MNDQVVVAEGLTKVFGETAALDGLDLEVTQGEVHGFLGPNGSGKSTTIRIVLGLMRATGGKVTLFGRDPWTDAVDLHRRLAYVPGDVTLWPKLTGGQCIDILARANGHLDETRRAELIERFELDPAKKARDYSKGNRQKVSLVAALATDAEFLILDEPTSGLDPLMERVFQSVIAERVAEGATVLLSSHILAEVEALADRVTIIRDGKRVLSGTLDELRQHTHSEIRATCAQRPDLDIDGVSALAVTEASSSGFEVQCSVEPRTVAEAVERLHASGIETLTITPPSLDDLFLHVYQGPNSAADSLSAS